MRQLHRDRDSRVADRQPSYEGYERIHKLASRRVTLSISLRAMTTSMGKKKRATLAWLEKRIAQARVFNEVGESEMIATHLWSQSNKDAMRREAEGLLGSSTPAARALIEELCFKVWGQEESRPKAKQNRRVASHRKKEATGPVNCLRCGLIATAPMEDSRGEVSPSEAYVDITSRLRGRREEWPKCVACGEALGEQLRHGDAADDQLERAVSLAAKLVRYDRETAQRTHVIDDQTDWYETPKETATTSYLAKIDFAGRKVVVDDNQADWTPSGIAARGMEDLV